MGKEAFFKIARGIVQMGQRFMLDNRSKSKNFVLDKLSNLIIKNEIDIDLLFTRPKYSRLEAKKILEFVKASDFDLESFLSLIASTTLDSNPS